MNRCRNPEIHESTCRQDAATMTSAQSPRRKALMIGSRSTAERTPSFDRAIGELIADIKWLDHVTVIVLFMPFLLILVLHAILLLLLHVVFAGYSGLLRQW